MGLLLQQKVFLYTHYMIKEKLFVLQLSKFSKMFNEAFTALGRLA